MRSVLLVAMMMSGAAWAAEDPFAALEHDEAMGVAPLSGRRGDLDEARMVLDQGKGLDVELARLPRGVEAQGLGAGVTLGGNWSPAPPPPVPPPPQSGGMFGFMLPGFNFGN